MLLIFFSFTLTAVTWNCSPSPEIGRQEKPAKVVMGYYYSGNREKFGHEDIEYRLLTHIAHAFTKPDQMGNLIIDEGYIYPELVQEAHEHGVRMIMGIGGWGRCEGFPGMASSAVNRARFITQVVAFCKRHRYDGVDIDWEYVSNPDEKTNFVLFIEELSSTLKALDPPLELSMAAPSGHFWGHWFDYEELTDDFDYISFMTYDYHGQWSDHSGHIAPLYSCDDDPCGSMSDTYDYSQSRKVPNEKLLLGIPFYGRSFDCEGLYKKFQNSRYYDYRQAANFLHSGWEYMWDDCAKVPYLQDPEKKEIICFDDERSVSLKCRFVIEKEAAGVIIWELSGDHDGISPILLETIGREFR
ncbi:MAG: glycoside hydrolase family 18 protein [Candidatus Aminicenantes bacterium]|nr:MAG: glycoside hydrolase family 18 protein [Candidatus Aminicenantes bacterium]